MLVRRRWSAGAAAALLLAASPVGLLVFRPSPGSAATAHGLPATQGRADVPPSLYENFAVLRHPRTRADRLPAIPKPTGGCRRGQSRLVANSDGVKAWIVPGKSTVCLIVKSAQGWASQASGSVESTAGYRAGKRPLGSLNVGSIKWKPNRRILTMLFPDGTGDVQLRRGTQITRTLTVENNAIQTRPGSATSIWWRAPDGSQGRLTLH